MLKCCGSWFCCFEGVCILVGQWNLYDYYVYYYVEQCDQSYVQEVVGECVQMWWVVVQGELQYYYCDECVYYECCCYEGDGCGGIVVCDDFDQWYQVYCCEQ